MKQWNLADIQQLITDGIEEGKTLEYKAADALGKQDGKKNEISKDVSAFANSNGGVLIYGIKEFDASNLKHKPEKIDPIDRAEYSKEWLEQIINTRIQPKIENLDIQTVEISSVDNTVVYVVMIPKSNTAHMAASNKYYKRYNFQAEAMEDYEVKDVMNRSKHPRIELDFLIEKTIQTVPKQSAPMMQLIEGNQYTTITSSRLKIYAKNNGTVYANYVNYYVKVNKNFLASNETEFLDEIIEDNSGRKYVELYGENTVRDVVDVKVLPSMIGGSIEKYGPSRFDPILPGMRSRSDNYNINANFNVFNEEIITWKVFADNAAPVIGEVRIADIQVKTIEIKE